jgi:hypothetical protein
MWWCNHCDPYLHGALPGRLQIIETYVDALNYVGNYCKGRKSDYRFLILALAQAKGLPKRVGEAAVQEWLNGTMIAAPDVAEQRATPVSTMLHSLSI